MNKMKKKGIFKRLSLCAVSLAMLASSVACGRPANAGPPSGTITGGKIAVICKNENVSFWDQVKVGAEDACEEQGFEMLYYCATGDNDFSSQIEYINDAIDKGVNAIVIAPNGVTELNDAFAKAEAAGIKLININSRADYEGIASCVSSSDTDAGEVAARNAAQLMLANADGSKPANKIGIIGHTAATADNRIQGFKDEFAYQLGMYIDAQRQAAMEEAMANAEPATDEEGNPVEGAAPSTMRARSEGETAAMIANYFIEGERCSSIDAAYEEAKKLIQNNSDLRIMFATNTNTTLGVCKAIEELDKSEDIIVVGFNSDEQELRYIRTGVLDGTVIQNPYTMGYISVRYAKQAMQGTKLAPTLDTGVTFISANNINDEVVQLLLYPDRK